MIDAILWTTLIASLISIATIALVWIVLNSLEKLRNDFGGHNDYDRLTLAQIKHIVENRINEPPVKFRKKPHYISDEERARKESFIRQPGTN